MLQANVRITHDEVFELFRSAVEEGNFTRPQLKSALVGILNSLQDREEDFIEQHYKTIERRYSKHLADKVRMNIKRNRGL